MSQSERRLAAIMYTDMVGYTALGQRNESLSFALVEEQRKLIRSILARHNGREIKTMGDAFLVEFPSALDAVRCAYDIQRATREFNIPLPAEKRIHLRVGVHLGDVVAKNAGVLKQLDPGTQKDALSLFAMQSMQPKNGFGELKDLAMQMTAPVLVMESNPVR